MQGVNLNNFAHGGFKRFILKSNTKVKVEFGLVALAHYLRKHIAVERMRSNVVSSCL